MIATVMLRATILNGEVAGSGSWGKCEGWCGCGGGGEVVRARWLRRGKCACGGWWFWLWGGSASEEWELVGNEDVGWGGSGGGGVCVCEEKRRREADSARAGRGGYRGRRLLRCYSSVWELGSMNLLRLRES